MSDKNDIKEKLDDNAYAGKHRKDNNKNISVKEIMVKNNKNAKSYKEPESIKEDAIVHDSYINNKLNNVNQSLLASIIVYMIIAISSFVIKMIKIGFSDQDSPVFDEKHYSTQAMQLLLNGGIENNPGFGLIVHPPLGKFLISIGEYIFGYTPLGWRFMSILAGVTIVLLICGMVHKLTQSLSLTVVAAVIANTEGVLFVMSRMGMLDIFQSLFITIIAFCLLQYMTTDYSTTPWTQRWWLYGIGVASGLAMGVKISGVYYPAVIGVVLVFTTLFKTKNFKETAKSFVHGLFCLFVIPVLVFFMTWIPWFRGETVWAGKDIQRQQAEYQLPDFISQLLPLKLENWISSQVSIMDFHTSLTTSSGNLHPWESKPWNWLYGDRPMVYWSQMSGDHEGKIYLLGNMAVWWLVIPLLLWGLLRIITTLDTGWIIATGGFLAGWVPWLIGYDRQMYFFYATALAPFVVMMIALAINDISKIIANKKNKDIETTRLVIGITYTIIVIIVFLIYSVWYYGIPVSDDVHDKLSILNSWEPLEKE